MPGRHSRQIRSCTPSQLRDPGSAVTYAAKGISEVVRKNLRRLVLARVGEDREFKTQEQFAIWHNIPKSTLSQVLNSKRSPRLDTIETLSIALGVPVIELFRIPRPVPDDWDAL